MHDYSAYKVTKYGNEYGGFYVFDDNIRTNPNAIVYSFGIGTDLSFSEAIFKRVVGVNVYAFDPTPKSIKFVKAHSLFNNPNFHFSPFGISDENGTEKFYLPINDSYVSGSVELRGDLKDDAVNVQMRSLAAIMKENGHKHIDLLKMDVEGSEFKVIESLKDNNILIDQICVEIHDRFFANGFQKLRKMLESLRVLGYVIISVSESLDDLTFLKIKEDV